MMKKFSVQSLTIQTNLRMPNTTEPEIAETLKDTNHTPNDFVAMDTKNNRVCVCGSKDKFTAVMVDGKWEKGYPEFDDLMDYFIEVNNLADIEKFSLDARTSINFYLTSLKAGAYT